MIGSLWIAYNGLDTLGKSIEVIGNNIANVSTTGFKYDTVTFGDLLVGAEKSRQDLSTTLDPRGSAVLNYPTVFLQGPILESNSNSDLAISGNGFFQLNDSGGNAFYTRNGEFILDKDGYLVNTEGYRLQGFAWDPETETFAADTSALRIPPTESSRRTTEFHVEGLRLNFEDGQGPLHTLHVYDDNVGRIADIGISFSILPGQRNGDTPWRCLLKPSDGTITNLNVPQASNPPVDPPLQAGEAAVDFYFDNGSLAGVGAPGMVRDLSFDFNLGGTSYNITWNLTDPENPDRFAPNGIISTTLPSYGGELIQDGYDNGELQNFRVNADGIVYAEYNNDKAESTVPGRIALVTFPSVAGLRKVGKTLFEQTEESGSPSIGAANSGARGTILQASLEQSNVDLGNELVRLLAEQQGFTANSMAVTTSSQMLDTAIQMKRA